ncbi:MFS transporter [Nocardioides terrisoli]|uniref:MFS transporter n=1 Tax=Nocardioides terrisoli TaxID=3388267 RepID=UPI00287B6D01|nr:MFS transporter [Nocardioides marmorisolisilvae]
MPSPLEVLAPARLGGSFRWLLASAWVSNLGDGIALAAGPLLVASQTHSPFLVASAAMVQRVPWLLLGLFAGAIADRVDRRLLVALVDLARACVLAVLAAAIVMAWVDITVVLVAMFLLGVAEVFADTTSGTLLPMLVAKPDLGTANARLQGASLITNQMAGPPLGAGLFALGTALPFVTQGVFVALGAVLVLQVRVRRLPTRTGGAAAVGGRVREEIREGISWLLGHPAMRTLALVILTFNVTWGAAWSVLVLWALERLGMGEVGFGLLTTATAIGGLAATATFGWLDRNVSYQLLMKVCLTTEVLMHLALALTTAPWVALLLMFCFGFYAFVWATVSQTIRQRTVPEEFQGRVGSVYLVGIFGGLVIGQAIGGVIADHWGVVAPFWFAFVGSGITLALVWRQLAHIARATAST